MNGIVLNFRGAFISTMFGGGIALIITGGVIYKDAISIGEDLIYWGKILVGVSVGWYFLRIIAPIVADWLKSSY